MKTVRQILARKGGGSWSTSPHTTVYDALKLMADKNVGALVVVEGERMVGIFSERDYARKVILKGKSSREMAVSEIMTANVITVAPDQSIEDCMTLMSENHIRHLPVLQHEKLVGLVSIGDVVQTIIADQKSTINQLEDYITGRR